MIGKLWILQSIIRKRRKGDIPKGKLKLGNGVRKKGRLYYLYMPRILLASLMGVCNKAITSYNVAGKRLGLD